MTPGARACDPNSGCRLEVTVGTVFYTESDADDENGFVNLDEFDVAIESLQENTKLKAEIEQLKSTISKMEATTAQEDDLK